MLTKTGFPRKKVSSLFLFLTLVFVQLIFGQEHSAMIGEDIAIFYPENFDIKANLPSFALVQEPKEISPVPKNWKTKVEFSSLTGKSAAYIKIDRLTDIYGTGEVTGSLLRNGTSRKIWNTDTPSYKRDNGTRLYQSHPWVLGVRPDGTAFGVLADNTWKMEVSIGEGITFLSDGPAFRVIIIEKEKPQDIIKALAELTGTVDLPPLWSLGYQQCRWSYYPDTRVQEIADTFRVKQIPCDVIWMDIHYMDEYRIFTFSPEKFSNPKATNDYLHKKGFKSVWMIDPGVKAEPGYFVYDSGTEKKVWVKNKNGENFVGPVWPGDCVFPDFTQEKTAKWWAGLYKNFMATGVDGVWNDMNEPSVFGAPDWTMPEDNIHLGSGDLPKDIHQRYHNVYGMLMVKASKEGIQTANPNKRPFVLTRSNFIGGHRYAATWTGDNASTWKHLQMSIPMVLNMGLSGQPFTGPDIGGFNEDATPELFGQWIALGAFYPFSRGHTRAGSINHEPWAFGKKIENVSRTALQRRYRLLPYFYTLFHESSVNGMPVMRPVFFADYKDRNLRSEDQAFLLGEDLLIIPKWAEFPKLPKGDWRTISIVGEDTQKDKYQPEVKLRPGAILPLSNVIQNTTEYSLETLTLYINLDEKGEAEGKLYNDAGDGFDYKKGQYSLTTFSARSKGNEVIVKVENTDGKQKLNTKKIVVKLYRDSGVLSGVGNLKKPIKIKL